MGVNSIERQRHCTGIITQCIRYLIYVKDNNNYFLNICYSAEVSLITFSIGVGFSILLMMRKHKFHKVLGYFLGFVSLMQFIEFLLWRHQICDTYHKLLSVIGMILNHAQPVILALVTAYIYKKNTYLISAITFIYLAVIIPYSIQYTNSLQCSTVHGAAGNPHLVWNWNTMKYSNFAYIIFLTAFVGIALFGMPLHEGRSFALVAVLTYTGSSLIYERKVVGALWCFWTAFIPMIIYLLN